MCVCNDDFDGVRVSFSTTYDGGGSTIFFHFRPKMVMRYHFNFSNVEIKCIYWDKDNHFGMHKKDYISDENVFDSFLA